jgi:DegV family protein with EDD domain
MLKIITDSTSDLEPGLAGASEIEVIPLSVAIGGRNFRDGLDIHSTELFALVEQYGELPKTAAPSAGDFECAFDHEGESLFVGISSGLSATYQSACAAAGSFPAGKVHVLDSLNISMGSGMLALRAAELRGQGRDTAAILNGISAMIPQGRTTFLIETMEYLYKGGRCTGLQAFMGSLLKIRPIIEINPAGAMAVKEKARGTRQKALRSMLDDFESQLENIDLHRVSISHTGCHEDAALMAEEIRRIAAPEDIRIAVCGSVVCSHGGPDTLGLEYFLK